MQSMNNARINKNLNHKLLIKDTNDIFLHYEERLKKTYLPIKSWNSFVHRIFQWVFTFPFYVQFLEHLHFNLLSLSMRSDCCKVRNWEIHKDDKSTIYIGQSATRSAWEIFSHTISYSKFDKNFKSHLLGRVHKADYCNSLNLANTAYQGGFITNAVN